MLDKHVSLFVGSTMAVAEFKILIMKLAEGDAKAEAPENLLEIVRKHLYVLRSAYIRSDLMDHVGPLDRLDQAVNSPIGSSSRNSSFLSQQMRHFLLGLKDLLENEFYFHLDAGDVPNFIGPILFGPKVASKFDLAAEDIDEAGKCLALQRPTACVFHLMRVLELGVQKYGKKLKIPINAKQETWYQIIMHVNIRSQQCLAKPP